MRLVDLEPQFIRYVLSTAGSYHGRPRPDGTIQWGGFPVDGFDDVATFADADGIEFLCPACFKKNDGPVGTHLVQVWFAHGKAPRRIGVDSNGKTVRWSARGTSYDDLVLSPSIHVRTGCGWHGFVGTSGAPPGGVITV